MNDTQTLHQEAMDLAEQAALSKRHGDEQDAERLTQAAFAKEKEAALQVASDHALEPTRSVLLRSAASLALECRDLLEAERLVSLALSGHPPVEIADELREVLHQVYLDLDWHFFRPQLRQA